MSTSMLQADKDHIESLLKSLSTLQERLSEPSDNKRLVIEDGLKTKLTSKLSDLTAQLSEQTTTPKRRRTMMKVSRLETVLREDDDGSILLELRVRNDSRDAVAAMAMDVDTLDADSMENAFNFIMSTSYRTLAITLSRKITRLSDRSMNFFLEALAGHELENVEMRVGKNVSPSWIHLLERFRTSQRNVDWGQLDFYGASELTLDQSELLKRMLLDMANVRIFSFSCNTKLENEAAVLNFAAGIQNSTSLTRLDLTRVEFQNDNVEMIVGRAIQQSTLLTEVDFPNRTMQTDLLALLSCIVWNKKLMIPKLYANCDLRIFQIATFFIKAGRSASSLQVNIFKSENGGSPPGMEDFFDSLADNHTFTDIAIKGHVHLTKDQLKQMWASLQQQSHMESLELNLTEMPQGWEIDFVDALPKLTLKHISLGPRNFDANVVGWQHVFNVIKANYDIEYLDIAFHKYVQISAEESRFREQVEHYCRWNFSGRRIELMDPSSFNIALWPNVLGNLNKLGGSAKGDKISRTYRLVMQMTGNVVDEDMRVKRRAQMIYDFMRGPLLEAFHS